jgi:hypothetical protein
VTEAAGRNRSWGKWLVAIVLLVTIAFVFLGLFGRPKLVTVVHPQRISLTETIASSARAGGV